MTPRSSQTESASKSRRRAELSPQLEKSMSAYASAALAAGVSLLAIAKSAEAKIVYTPADVKIPVNGGAVPLDLNHDGIVDFVFSNVFYRTGSERQSINTVYVGTGGGNARNTGNKFWGQGSMSASQRFASALHAGISVRSNKSHFQKRTKGVMARVWVDYFQPGPAAPCIPHTGGCVSGTGGQWLYTRNRYLGLRFLIDGHAHYGWARVVVNRPATGNSIVATLTGYAYETVPDKPIITGATDGPDVITLEPVTLGRLAQGSGAITTWRVKK
jgi:hypothetical protein